MSTPTSDASQTLTAAGGASTITITASPPPAHPLQAFQSHCTAFLNNFSSNPLASAIGSVPSQAKKTLDAAVSLFKFPPPKPKKPVWARVAPAQLNDFYRLDSEPVATMKIQDTNLLEERLAGIPVYALSNSEEEFMLVSGTKTGKSLGLFCFKEEDAQSLLEQMKQLNPSMQEGSKVVAVSLDKVCQLNVNSVAFRFIPDPLQISNAVKVMKQLGDSSEGFPGVPVFQSRSLVLRNKDKKYRPVFFRKEDLEDSLYRTSKGQKCYNPIMSKRDILVCSLEDVITHMKGESTSEWDDVVFIPPGFDLSSAHYGPQEKKTTATP